MVNKFKVKTPPKKNNIKTVSDGYYKLYPRFSFKNYIKSDEYFSEEHSNERRNSLYNFFKNIQAFSGVTWGEMRQNPKQYHFHPFNENLAVLNKYSKIDLDQFKILGQKQGRFIGFFDQDNVFNILLYDSQHQGNPRK